MSIDYDHLSRLCLKYWKWLAAGVIVGAGIGLMVALSQTPIYAARSTIAVQAQESHNDGVTASPDYQSGELIKTFEQMLQTRNLTEQVVKSENLNENPEFAPAGATLPISEDEAVDILSDSTTIHLRPLTRLIDITVEHRSPKMAKFLADKVAEESIKQQFNQKINNASDMSDSLSKEVDQLKQKAADAESKLVAYQKTHKEGPELGQTDDEVRGREQALEQALNSAETQVALLEERYGPNHPKLIIAEHQVEELQNQVRQAQQGVMADSQDNIEYTTLKSEAESAHAQLDSVLKELRQMETEQTVNSAGIEIEEHAELPGAPVRPSKSKLVGIGGFLGLLGGLGFIFVLYFMDSSIRTVSQAENTFNVPVIAAVPILTATEGKTVLPTFSDPQSFVAEAFRGLRASLLLQDRETPLRTIVVCSAIPGEGKSFCAANLAAAFAQAGLKTLLIDADLRLPTIHSYFNITQDEAASGLPAVLSGRTTLSSSVLKSQIPTLDLLLTTTPADSPAELLSGIRLPLVLDEAAGKYDRVVIDSAPLNAVSDTMLIMPKADAILLVVRAGQTPSSETKGALQKISSGKMKPLGLILNYLAAHTLKSYAYGYSYGQKPKEKYAK
jgi:polysaccharide biosynthesis transport protein